MAGLDLSLNSSRHSNGLASPDPDSSPYKSSESACSTPRKNKRKSSEPKRRSDFSIKRFCSDMPESIGTKDLETEEGGRPGYGEHPPSTPENSATSSSPSPPDATHMRTRVPFVITPHCATSSRTPVGSPPGLLCSTTDTAKSQAQLPTPLPHQAHPHSILSPYLPGAVGDPALMAMNPFMMQYMLHAYSSSGVPEGASVDLKRRLAMVAALTGQLPMTSPPVGVTSSVHNGPNETSAQTAMDAMLRTHANATGGVTNTHKAPDSSLVSPNKRSHPHPAMAVPKASASTPSTSSQSRNCSRNKSGSNGGRSRQRSQTANKSLSSSRTSNDSSIGSLVNLSDSLCTMSDNEEEMDTDGSRPAGRKNYKNMTRERRMEANARERSRVHTISAAFDSLRRSVPSFSHTQRLSKLAILRIACSYISALANLAGEDYSGSESPQGSLEECVDQCTRTIQNEGRAKRRH